MHGGEVATRRMLRARLERHARPDSGGRAAARLAAARISPDAVSADFALSLEGVRRNFVAEWDAARLDPDVSLAGTTASEPSGAAEFARVLGLHVSDTSYEGAKEAVRRWRAEGGESGAREAARAPRASDETRRAASAREALQALFDGRCVRMRVVTDGDPATDAASATATVCAAVPPCTPAPPTPAFPAVVSHDPPRWLQFRAYQTTLETFERHVRHASRGADERLWREVEAGAQAFVRELRAVASVQSSEVYGLCMAAVLLRSKCVDVLGAARLERAVVEARAATRADRTAEFPELSTLVAWEQALLPFATQALCRPSSSARPWSEFASEICAPSRGDARPPASTTAPQGRPDVRSIARGFAPLVFEAVGDATRILKPCMADVDGSVYDATSPPHERRWSDARVHDPSAWMEQHGGAFAPGGSCDRIWRKLGPSYPGVIRGAFEDELGKRARGGGACRRAVHALHAAATGAPAASSPGHLRRTLAELGYGVHAAPWLEPRLRDVAPFEWSEYERGLRLATARADEWIDRLADECDAWAARERLPSPPDAVDTVIEWDAAPSFVRESVAPAARSCVARWGEPAVGLAFARADAPHTPIRMRGLARSVVRVDHRGAAERVAAGGKPALGRAFSAAIAGSGHGLAALVVRADESQGVVVVSIWTRLGLAAGVDLAAVARMVGESVREAHVSVSSVEGDAPTPGEALVSADAMPYVECADGFRRMRLPLAFRSTAEQGTLDGACVGACAGVVGGLEAVVVAVESRRRTEYVACTAAGDWFQAAGDTGGWRRLERPETIVTGWGAAGCQMLRVLRTTPPPEPPSWSAKLSPRLAVDARARAEARGVLSRAARYESRGCRQAWMGLDAGRGDRTRRALETVHAGAAISTAREVEAVDETIAAPSRPETALGLYAAVVASLCRAWKLAPVADGDAEAVEAMLPPNAWSSHWRRPRYVAQRTLLRADSSRAIGGGVIAIVGVATTRAASRQSEQFIWSRVYDLSSRSACAHEAARAVGSKTEGTTRLAR